MTNFNTQPGVTVAFEARMEYDPTGGDSSGWGFECTTPLEAVGALYWKLGQLTAEESPSSSISFSDSIDTIRPPWGEEDPNDKAVKWRAFAASAAAGHNAEIILHGKRWLVRRDERTCSDGPGPDCSGTVNYHAFLSGTGNGSNRCDGHWAESCKRHDEIRQRYPDTEPDDFDPTYAGERWYEPDDPRYH